MRPAGTVGGDETWLRSSVPAAVPNPAAALDPVTGEAPVRDPVSVPATQQASTTTASAPTAPAPVHEPVVARRSLDDSDLGWGDRADDSNDDRLQRNRPPHW